MSLVIMIKDKNRIIVGADKQASTGDSKTHTNTKIWRMTELPGAIMGSVGSARASQLIQYSNIIDKNLLQEDLTTEYIVKVLAPTIAEGLKANGIVVETPQGGVCDLMPNAFLIAYKDNAWMIWNDLSVSEIEGYLAIGSGSDVAKGALFATEDKNPFERILISIKAAADTTLFVDDNLDLLATSEEEEDGQLIINAFRSVYNIEEAPVKKKARRKKSKKSTKTKTK